LSLKIYSAYLLPDSSASRYLLTSSASLTIPAILLSYLSLTNSLERLSIVLDITSDYIASETPSKILS
ncbi:MAG: hypothetical protein ACK5NI_02000, partial [bacterium]